MTRNSDPSRDLWLVRFMSWLLNGDGPTAFVFIVLVIVLGLAAYGLTWVICNAVGRDVPEVMKPPPRKRP